MLEPEPLPENMCSKDLSDLIFSLLNKDHKKRPAIKEVVKMPMIKEAILRFLEDWIFTEDYH